MAQSKYKRHSRGGRFRQQGEGSRAGVDNIRQQRQTEIDALKTQALQQKERDSLQIAGLRNVSKTEAENRNILQDLENKIYQNKRNAITVRSQTEVDALLGQAKELGREAEFWEEFATKHSQNYAKLATGVYDYAQYRSAINAYESMSDDQKNLAVASYENNYNIVENEMGESIIEINSLKDRKDLITSTVGRFANNRYLHKMLANDYIQTNKATQDLLRSATTPDGKALYSKDTAAAMTMNKAYNFIHSHGIPLNSEAAQKIISSAKQTAVIEVTSLTKADELKTDTLDIEELIRVAKDNYAEINNPAYYVNKKGEKVYVENDNAIKLKNFIASKTGNESLRVASGRERFNNSLYLIYHALDGSHVKGTNGILAPGDPSRQAETPKQKWTRVLEMVADGLDFKTVADGVDILNIPVRDMKSGQVILNKNNEPAEYLLDKHPELKTEIIRILKEKQSNSISDRDLKIRTEQLKGFTKFNTQLESDFDDNNFINTLLNKDWVLSASTWALDKKNSGSEESNFILDVLGQSPELFSKQGKFSDNKILSQKIYRVDNEFFSGDVNGALFSYTQIGEEVPRLAKMHEALVDANKIPEFSKEVKNFITNEFAGNIAGGITSKNIANKNDLLHMVDKGVGRFMVVWASKSDIVDVDARLQATKDILDKEISDGLNKQIGWAAATELGSSGDTVLGYKFNALSNKDVPTGTVYKDKDIDNFFSIWDNNFETLSSGGFFDDATWTGDQDSINKQKVKDVLITRFDDLVTLDDAYRLLNAISTGTASNQSLPKNLAKFIKGSKRHQHGLTTRDIMNMAIEHIKNNGDSIWTKDQTIDSQFKDYNYEWPASTDDLIKKTCNITPRDTADGIGITTCQFLKDRGIDMNQTIIEEYIRKRERFN